jgi:pectin methylesterase-like acyl-CoA thioesterase
VRNGTYDLGKAFNTQVKDYTTLVGQSRDGVIIENHPEHEGINYSTTLKTGSNVIMQNLTLRCNVVKGSSVGFADGATENDERGTALYDNGTNNVYKNIRLLGFQDTYYSHDYVNSYFENCEIHGAVDFICGSGNVWFEKCDLLIESSSVAYITAARKNNTPGEYNGYIFNECTIDNADDADMAGKYYLGRAWDGYAKVSYYKTTKKSINDLTTINAKKYVHYA